MQIELPVSKIKVDLIEKLGWGIRQKIKAAMMGKINFDVKNADDAEVALLAENMYRGKVRAMQLCITKMTAEDGTEVTFSEDWLDFLDEEDGETLYTAIDSIAKGK